MEPTTRAHRLLFPALRADGRALPMDPDDPGVRAALERGPGGFILFGGEAGAVRDLTRRLRSAAPAPLLFGADLERGAGQQFEGATPLPPLAALGSLGDLEVLWRAGELTAREAGALGVRWIYAPVADLGNEPGNPVIGTRSLGADPEAVGRGVAAWTLGCLAGGGLPCVKHFPGHGRTTADSHLARPVVRAGRGELARDLVPFAAAVAAGVPSVMTAHVAYPALDPDGRPATLSPPILQGLLRGRLGFERVVVSDALVMEGFADVDGEAEAAVDAVAAGVDALLYPRRPGRTGDALHRAASDGLLPRGALARAVARVEALVGRAEPGRAEEAAEAPPPVGLDEDRRWADALADRTLRLLGAEPALPPEPPTLVVVDDDRGGPFPPPARRDLPDALAAAGVPVRETSPDGGPAEGSGGDPAGRAGPTLVAVYAEARGWKGRAGLSEASEAALRTALERSAHPLVLLFGHPRLAASLSHDVPVLCAWGGEAIMQRAAGRRVAALLGR